VTIQRPADIARMFDAIAGAYDFLNHLLSAGLDRQWRRRAVEALALTSRETVLDVCTGTADLALAAVTGPSRAERVVGIDVSASMLAHGRAKVVRRGAARAIQFLRGDATRLPVRSSSVGAVMVAFGLRNVEPLADALCEIHRVLRDGGRLAVLEFALPGPSPVRRLYLWYFTRVLPVVGRVVSRHASAYTYLPASVASFHDPVTFGGMLRAHGFSDVRSDSLTFGIVYLYVATKTPRTAE
jgi:demethylmenaquinone methyltransferase/2-methoxy-6-polyprenyl-1,4-benzoquinol methylase